MRALHFTLKVVGKNTSGTLAAGKSFHFYSSSSTQEGRERLLQHRSIQNCSVLPWCLCLACTPKGSYSRKGMFLRSHVIARPPLCFLGQKTFPGRVRAKCAQSEGHENSTNTVFATEKSFSLGRPGPRKSHEKVTSKNVTSNKMSSDWCFLALNLLPWSF